MSAPIFFAPSDKVVLVDGRDMPRDWWTKLPKEGRVYCVRAVQGFPESGRIGVKLVGIRSKGAPYSSCWFNASRFRLLQGSHIRASEKVKRQNQKGAA